MHQALKYVGCAPVVQLRTQAEFEALHNVKAPAGKRYFQHTRLHDIIGAYPFRSGLSDSQVAHEKERREAFLDFLLGVLVRSFAPSVLRLSWLVPVQSAIAAAASCLEILDL
jgi:hypothetical protein